MAHTTICRTATVVEAGRSRPALTRFCRPSWVPKAGQRQVNGTLNGHSYTFRCTHGPGKGSVDHHYAYIEGPNGSWWYVDTDDGYLSEGAEVEFSEWAAARIRGNNP